MNQTKELLSVIIPAHNEEGCIESTVVNIITCLEAACVPHEILIVNDNSVDGTENILKRLVAVYPSLSYVNNEPPHGFGSAVKKGLSLYKGDAAAIMMADASDDPRDLVVMYEKIVSGCDCVFGSRFMKEGLVERYPKGKFILNRLGNYLIKKVFSIDYDDITNAFKCYRREVVDRARPLLANHFNLTVELPVKAIIYGYKYCVVPTRWINRKHGISKLNIRQMAKRYLIIILFLFLKKYLIEDVPVK